MAVRNIAQTDTLETFRQQFNDLAANDFGDIANLDSTLTATSIVGAVNEINQIAISAAGFFIEDASSNVQSIGAGQTLNVRGTTNEIEVAVSATDTLTIGLPSTVTIATSALISNITIGSNSITSAGGSIGFGNENLNTTGTFEATSGITTSGTVQAGGVTATGTITGAQMSLTSGGITFEGATNDQFETVLTVTDPTADRTLTLPDESGTLVTSSSLTTTTNYVGTNQLVDDAVTSAKLLNAVNLIIYNSAGSVVKSLWGASS